MGRRCILCGRNRPNEKFGGKGFRSVACADCRRLPKEEQQRRLAWDEIGGFLRQRAISAKNIARLESLKDIADADFQILRTLLIEVAKIAPRKRKRWRNVKAVDNELFSRCVKSPYFDLIEFSEEFSDEWDEKLGLYDIDECSHPEPEELNSDACEDDPPVCFDEIRDLLHDNRSDVPFDDADDYSFMTSSCDMSDGCLDELPEWESVMILNDASAPMTLDEFVNRPASINGSQEELVDGVVVARPLPSFRHGLAQGQVAAALIGYVRPQGLGRVVLRTGLITHRDPDTVRGPDVAYWSRERLPLGVEVEVYPDVAADLCVEILSPNERPREVHQKIREYFECGVRMVWIVDPEAQSVTVYRSSSEGRLLWDNATISGEDVLPGFECSVIELFK